MMTTTGRILPRSYTKVLTGATAKDFQEDFAVASSTQNREAQATDEESCVSIVAQLPAIIESFDYHVETMYEHYIDVKTAPFSLLYLATFWPMRTFPRFGVVFPVVLFLAELLYKKNFRSKFTLEMFIKERVGSTVITVTGLHHVQPSRYMAPAYTLDIPFCAIRSVDVRTGGWVQLTLDPTEEEDADGLEFISSGYFRFSKAPKPKLDDANQKQALQFAIMLLKEPVRFKKLITAMKNKETCKVAAAALPVDVLLFKSMTAADKKE